MLNQSELGKNGGYPILQTVYLHLYRVWVYLYWVYVHLYLAWDVGAHCTCIGKLYLRGVNDLGYIVLKKQYLNKIVFQKLSNLRWKVSQLFPWCEKSIPYDIAMISL